MTRRQITCLKSAFSTVFCLTWHSIKCPFRKPPPHTSPGDGAAVKPLLLCDRPACNNDHAVFEAPQRPLGTGRGGVSSPATQLQFEPLPCGGEMRAAAQEPPLRLRHKSPTLHYGFHIRAFIQALSHSNELRFAALQSPWLRSVAGPHVTAPTRLHAVPLMQSGARWGLCFFCISVIVKL